MRLPVSVAFGLVLLPAIPATAQGASAAATVEPMVPAGGTVLDVTAEGRTTRVPDLATIRAGVMAQAPTAAAALTDNAQQMTRVLARLRRAGVEPRDIATASIQLSPQYRYAENQPPVVTGYQAANSVSVRFREIGRAGSILDALVAEGANQIDGPGLSLSNPDAALDDARSDAVKRARAKADVYARAAGLRVVRMVSITETGQSEGGSPPPMVFARAVRADAPTEIAPGEKEITVTLSVRFLLG